MAPFVFEPFDVIVSSLCLETACLDEASYISAVKHVASLLKPGGQLFLDGVRGQTFYTVGNNKYNTFPLTSKIIEKTFAEAGLTNIRWCSDDQGTVDTYDIEGLPANFGGLFAVCATRITA